jgi:transposase-like protein
MKPGLDNIASRGKYGKEQDKVLLYCRTCGKRFAATRDTPLFGAHLPISKVHQIIHLAAEGVSVRATARFLGLAKNTANLAIVKVGEHCQNAYRSLTKDPQMNEAQLDELWAFVKKNGY